MKRGQERMIAINSRINHFVSPEELVDYIFSLLTRYIR